MSQVELDSLTPDELLKAGYFCSLCFDCVPHEKHAYEKIRKSEKKRKRRGL